MQSSKVIILISTEVSFQSISCRALLRLDNGTVDSDNDDFFIDSSDVRTINIFVSKFLLPRVTKFTVENNTLLLLIQTIDFYFISLIIITIIILVSLQQRSSGIPTISQSQSEEENSSSKNSCLIWCEARVLSSKNPMSGQKTQHWELYYPSEDITKIESILSWAKDNEHHIFSGLLL